MKKILGLFLLIFTFSISSVSAEETSISSLLNVIVSNGLITQEIIDDFMTKIESGELPDGSEYGPQEMPPTNSICDKFFRDLTVGSTGSDVTTLQTFLEEEGYLVMPQGVAKGYFGALTQNALAEYQSVNGIIASGYFGPITMAKLGNVCKGEKLKKGIPNTLSDKLKVKKPNGGEEYESGERIKVTWNSKNIQKEKINIKIQNSDGNISTLGTAVRNDGKDYIETEGLESGQYKIVLTTNNPELTVTDMSDDYFTIVKEETEDSDSDEVQTTSDVGDSHSSSSDDDQANNDEELDASITVKKPNGGEEYEAGEKITVTWNSKKLGKSKVNIGLYDGSNIIPLVENEKNDGKDGVETDGVEAGQYKFVVSASDSEIDASDMSDDYFTIVGE
jgi:peptidoglycan hydrolase-like protein with peptidoglycan-binding domain